MTEAELITRIAQRADLEKKQAKAALDALAAIAADQLVIGDTVPLPNIGKLQVAARAARQGMNPATGERITVPAKRVVTFKVASGLKARVV